MSLHRIIGQRLLQFLLLLPRQSKMLGRGSCYPCGWMICGIPPPLLITLDPWSFLGVYVVSRADFLRDWIVFMWEIGLLSWVALLAFGQVPRCPTIAQSPCLLSLRGHMPCVAGHVFRLGCLALESYQLVLHRFGEMLPLYRTLRATTCIQSSLPLALESLVLLADIPH